MTTGVKTARTYQIRLVRNLGTVKAVSPAPRSTAGRSLKSLIELALERVPGELTGELLAEITWPRPQYRVPRSETGGDHVSELIDEVLRAPSHRVDRLIGESRWKLSWLPTPSSRSSPLTSRSRLWDTEQIADVDEGTGTGRMGGDLEIGHRRLDWAVGDEALVTQELASLLAAVADLHAKPRERLQQLFTDAAELPFSSIDSMKSFAGKVNWLLDRLALRLANERGDAGVLIVTPQPGGKGLFRLATGGSGARSLGAKIGEFPETVKLIEREP